MKKSEEKEWSLRFLCVLLGSFGALGLLLLFYLHVSSGMTFSRSPQIIRFCIHYGLVPYVLLFLGSFCSSIIIAIVACGRTSRKL